MDKETIIHELKCPLRYEFVGNEKRFEENIVENIDLICMGLGLPEIAKIGEQKMIKVDGFFIRPDIIVRHVDGSMTVFGVKKVNEKYPATGPANQMTAVGQLLLYGNVLSAKTDGKVRLALIDNKIYYRTYCAFVGNRLPITLIDFQKDRVFVPYNGWGGVRGYPAAG
ncbi:MAG: hypothetical protein LUD78_09420 [Clostridiales bacterium]|nr:hypothetical protein [Clostridiales bacterium]